MRSRRSVARQLRGAPPRLPQSRTVLDRVGAPPPSLPPRWREREEISGHSLPQRADTSTIHSSLALAFPAAAYHACLDFFLFLYIPSRILRTRPVLRDATPPHPRAESPSSPTSRCRALVVPSASQNVVERLVLRVASDAEPQRCDCFLHRDSRPVVHVSRATTTRPAATTATAAARCAWGDDEVIMKIGRGRGSGLEANARVEVSCFPFPGALFPVSVSPALLFVFLPPLRACV
ncbi:hypothetical protein C8R45DRAFT_1045434 [Mycena sanguinolenta]|nr:hypothetical protein C8R45DRAFT_1045434 [Mycena sanguinolenta]